jgi:hypothetical protein
MAVATIEAVRQSDAVQLVLSGEWTLATLPQPISGLEASPARAGDQASPQWDYAAGLPPRQRRRDPALARLGTAVAGLAGRLFRPTERSLERVAAIHVAVDPGQPARSAEPLAWIVALGRLALSCWPATSRRWSPWSANWCWTSPHLCAFTRGTSPGGSSRPTFTRAVPRPYR